MMKRASLAIIVGALYVLHQDFWFWRDAQPLVFGFIPIGLFYHVCYTLVTALVLWLLVREAWPAELEEGTGEGETGRGGERENWRGGDHPLAASPGRPFSAEEGVQR